MRMVNVFYLSYFSQNLDIAKILEKKDKKDINNCGEIIGFVKKSG